MSWLPGCASARRFSTEGRERRRQQIVADAVVGEIAGDRRPVRRVLAQIVCSAANDGLVLPGSRSSSGASSGSGGSDAASRPCSVRIRWCTVGLERATVSAPTGRELQHACMVPSSSTSRTSVRRRSMRQPSTAAIGSQGAPPRSPWQHGHAAAGARLVTCSPKRRRPQSDRCATAGPSPASLARKLAARRTRAVSRRTPPAAAARECSTAKWSIFVSCARGSTSNRISPAPPPSPGATTATRAVRAGA